MWKRLKNALPQASGKRVIPPPSSSLNSLLLLLIRYLIRYFLLHFQLGHSLIDKAHRNRHRCVNCGPSEENRRNNDPWIFDTRNALKEHSLAAHKDLYDDKANYILCNICGNIIGKEVTDCGFLKPRKPSCARISNMSSKEVDSILIQQLRGLLH